jgi:hypothetical protein
MVVIRYLATVDSASRAQEGGVQLECETCPTKGSLLRVYE